MAHDRSITVGVEADVTHFQRNMASASQTVKGFQRDAAGLAKEFGKDMTTVGMAAAGAGLAIGAGLGLGVKAAVDWETAFTGVVKTVDATTAELDMLEQGLRDMAKEIPASHAELAGIAEAAGQLGIQTGNILSFTETIAALGVTTNLTSQEAAVAFARIANIMQIPQDQFDEMGSSVVALGNNMETTERDIVEFGTRIAGAGQIAGFTVDQVFAIGAAMSSVGVEAEAGGTAVQKVMISMTDAVARGNADLQTFASVSGMTAEEFSTMWESDAAGAFTRFVDGLGEAGSDAFGILENLGLQDQRLIRSFLSLAGAGDVLTKALGLSGEAWVENTALSDEAALRYETVASQIQTAKNMLYDLGITIGEVLLPVLIPMLDGVKSMVEWFAGLPEPVQTAAVALGAVSAVLLTIAGTALIMIPRILQLVAAYKALATAAGLASATMSVNAPLPSSAYAPLPLARGAGVVSKAVPAAAAGFAVFEAVQAGQKLASDIDRGNTDLAVQIRDLMIAAERGDETAVKRLADFRAAFIDNASWLNQNVRFQTEEFIANRAWLTAIEMMEEAPETVSSFNEAFRGGDDYMNEWSTATENAAGAAEVFARSVDNIATPMGQLIGDLVVAKENAENLFGVLRAASDPVFAAVEAWNAYVEALDAAEQKNAGVQEDFDVLRTKIDLQSALEQLGSDYDTAMQALSLATNTPISKLEEMFGLIEGYDGQTFSATFETQFRSSGTPPPTRSPGGFEFRAAGGPATAGSLYRVGEGNRPELFSSGGGLYMIPGDSGRVFSNAQSEALLAALSGNRGGGDLNITLHGTGDVARDMGTVVTMAGVMRRVETARR